MKKQHRAYSVERIVRKEEDKYKGQYKIIFCI